MVMVRGRVTGSGSPFNLGEMTVTRCTVSVAGVTGHALVRGRRTDHARLAAVADALLQDETWFGILSPHLIAPLREAEALHSGPAKRRRSGHEGGLLHDGARGG